MPKQRLIAGMTPSNYNLSNMKIFAVLMVALTVASVDGGFSPRLSSIRRPPPKIGLPLIVQRLLYPKRQKRIPAFLRPNTSAVKKSSPIRGKGFRNPSKAVRESASKPAKTSYNALKVSNYDVMIAPGNEFSLVTGEGTVAQQQPLDYDLVVDLSGEKDDINISNNNYGKITKTVAQSVPGPVNTDPEIVYGKPEELVTSPEPPVMVFPQSPDEDIAQSNLGDGFVPSTNYLSPSNEPVPSTNFLSTSNEPASNYLSPSNEPASNYLSPSNEPATNYLSPSNEPASNYLSPPNEPVTTVTQTSYVSSFEREPVISSTFEQAGEEGGSFRDDPTFRTTSTLEQSFQPPREKPAQRYNAFQNQRTPSKYQDSPFSFGTFNIKVLPSPNINSLFSNQVASFQLENSFPLSQIHPSSVLNNIATFSGNSDLRDKVGPISSFSFFKPGNKRY